MHLVSCAGNLFLGEFWVHPCHSRAGNDQSLAKDRAPPGSVSHLMQKSNNDQSWKSVQYCLVQHMHTAQCSGLDYGSRYRQMFRVSEAICRQATSSEKKIKADEGKAWMRCPVTSTRTRTAKLIIELSWTNWVLRLTYLFCLRLVGCLFVVPLDRWWTMLLQNKVNEWMNEWS